MAAAPIHVGMILPRAISPFETSVRGVMLGRAGSGSHRLGPYRTHGGSSPARTFKMMCSILKQSLDKLPPPVVCSGFDFELLTVCR
jgi:hypothetical protein